VQAVTSDGAVAWTANVTSNLSIPDFQGGLVVWDTQSVKKLDGLTGQAYPSYTYANPPKFGFPPLVVHTDGTIFTLDGDSVVGIDPKTGNAKFTIPMEHSITDQTLACDLPSPTLVHSDHPPTIGNLIVAGNEYAYVAYKYLTSSGIQSDCYNSEQHDELHLRLLRVGSDGSSAKEVVHDWTSDLVTKKWEGNFGRCQVAYGTTVSQSGVIPDLIFGDLITDADVGVLFNWHASTPAYTAFDQSGYGACQDTNGNWVSGGVRIAPPVSIPASEVYEIASTSASGTSESKLAIPGQSSLVQPLLQSQDGRFIGTVSTSAGSAMINFDQSANVWWAVTGDYFPVVSTADLGVIAASGSGDFLIFDQNGTPTGRLPNPPGDSWAGSYYAISGNASLASEQMPYSNYALSFGAVTGGNLSLNNSAVPPGPVIKTFIPFPIATNATISDYVRGVRLAIPIKYATLNFYPSASANLAEFQNQLTKRLHGVGFIGHSSLDPTGTFSVGLCFKSSGKANVSLECTIPSVYRDQVTPTEGVELTVVDHFSTNAKVVFIASCHTGSVFQSLWGIQAGSTGQALVVPDLSQFQGAVDLGHAATAWQTMMYSLTVEKKTIGQAVAEGNNSMATLNDPERWTVVGDSNVRITH
jgi:hypothetical protein